MQPLHADDRPAGIALASLAAFLIAGAMCWPLLVTGEVFVFFDTEGYFATGDKVFGIVNQALWGGGSGQSISSTVPAGTDEAGFLRSFGYSTFATGMAAVGGPLALALAQGWIAIFMLLALIPRQVVVPPALILTVPLAFTTLPWFTVFAMPDIFAAVIITFGAVLWRSFDDLWWWHKVVLVSLAACASLAHYGNPPLAFGLYALVLGGRLIQRRLTLWVVIAAALPVIMGPVANYGASAVVLDTPSTAPKHMPILLARSIEDGPATWYLAQACAEGEELAICEAFDGRVPEDITEFLWSDTGISSLSDAEMEAIRREEPRILLAAFLQYPVIQSWSLTRNAWRQFHSVGLAKMKPAPDVRSPPHQGTLGGKLIAVFDPLVDWTTLIGSLCLVPLVFMKRAYLAPVAIILTGLGLNALIFGGLSAPDDRYQARVAWILPTLALCFGFERLRLRFNTNT